MRGEHVAAQRRDRHRVHARRPHDLARDDVLGILPVHDRARMDLDLLGGEGAEEPPLLTDADELDEAPAHAAEIVVDAAAARDGHAEGGYDELELLLDPDDLEHRALVEVVALAPARGVAGGLEGGEHLEVGDEVPGRVAEGVVGPPRLHLLAGREDVGAHRREEARGDEDLVDDVGIGEDGLDDDARMAGQEGEGAHHLADLGEAPVGIEGVEEAQGVDGARDARLGGRGDELEALELAICRARPCGAGPR